MEQRSQEWFDARKGRITGSRVGSLLGVNPYTSRDGLMREMVREHFDAPSEFQGNNATEFGTAMEPHACADYQRRTGNIVTEHGLIVHPEYEFIGVSPDGLIADEGGFFVGGIEIKCPFYKKEAYSVLSKKKAYYHAQCQLVMHTCGLEWLDFYCFVADFNRDGSVRYIDHLIERITPDQAWWDASLPKFLDFRAEYLATIADAKLYGKHLREVGAPEPQFAEVDDPRLEELAGLAEDLASMKRRMKATQDLFDTLKREIGDEYGETISGHGIVLKRTEKAGQVDHKAVYAELGIDRLLSDCGRTLDHFRKPGTVAYEVVAL